MKLILKQQYQLYFLFIIWFVSGITLEIFSGIIILPSLILLLHKKQFWWAVLGLIIMMIFSDSRNMDLSFAQQLKGIYLIIFSGLLIFNINPFVRNPIFSYLIPFFIILFICLIWSDIPLIAFQKTISYILIFLVVPPVFMHEYRVKGEKIIKELSLFVVTIFFISLFLAFFIPEIGRLDMERWNGFLGNPNGLGIFLVLSLIWFEVTNQVFPGLYSRLFKITFYILLVVLLIGSGSRGAMLAIFGFFIAKVLMGISVFLGFLSLAFFFIFMNDIFNVIIEGLIALGYSEELRLDTLEQGSGRLVAWRFAWNEIQNHTFILGKGIDHEVYFMQKNYKTLSQMGHEGNAHNSYISFWMNTGLIGIITFFTPFIVFFIRAHKRNPLALPALIAIAISINFESWLSASLNPFTIMLVLILTLLVGDIFYKKEENIVDSATSE